MTLRDEPWAGRLDELEPQGTEMAERLAGDDIAMLEAPEREAADSPNPPNRETSGNMQDGGTSDERTMGETKNPRRDEERRRIAARLLDPGVPAKAIAAQLGVGRAWVRAVQKQRQAAIDPDTAA